MIYCHVYMCVYILSDNACVHERIHIYTHTIICGYRNVGISCIDWQLNWHAKSKNRVYASYQELINYRLTMYTKSCVI